MRVERAGGKAQLRLPLRDEEILEGGFVTQLAKRRQAQESLKAVLFVIPAAVFLAVFVFYPIVSSASLSLYKWDGVGPWKWVGLRNYLKVFRNAVFYKAFYNTVIFTLVASAGEMILGFLYAIVIDLGIPGGKAYRFIFYLPVTLSTVVISVLWVKILQPDGLINMLLTASGLGFLKQLWLANGKIALYSVCAISWWTYGGWHMIFFLAGMQSIDRSIYESAKIDGASTLRRVFSITIPLLKNVWYVLSVLAFILGFKVFDFIYVITAGGPAGATEVLGTQMYSAAFEVYEMGTASVFSVVMMVVALIISLVYVRVTGYRGEATRER